MMKIKLLLSLSSLFVLNLQAMFFVEWFSPHAKQEAARQQMKVEREQIAQKQATAIQEFVHEISPFTSLLAKKLEGMHPEELARHYRIVHFLINDLITEYTQATRAYLYCGSIQRISKRYPTMAAKMSFLLEKSECPFASYPEPKPYKQPGFKPHNSPDFYFQCHVINIVQLNIRIKKLLAGLARLEKRHQPVNPIIEEHQHILKLTKNSSIIEQRIQEIVAH